MNILVKIVWKVYEWNRDLYEEKSLKRVREK